MTQQQWQALDAEPNLLELKRLIGHLEELVEPGPRSHLPRYLTPQQRRAERELIRAERRDRVKLAHRRLPVLGASKAPVVITPASALALVHAGLCRLEALVFDRLGIVPWPHEVDPSDQRRCDRLIDRLPDLEDPFASWLLEETSRLVGVAAAAADEDAQLPMTGWPCPWCGREDTLVVYLDRDYVRCNNDQCVCPLSDCACHRHGYRHVWKRGQWGVLAEAIQARVRRTRAERREKAA